MKEKILQFLKGKLSNVQGTYLDGVAEAYSKTITEESQIETTFTDGIIDLIKMSAAQIQSEGDRRATDATQTAVTNYEKKYNLKDGKPVDGGGTPPNPVEPKDDDKNTPEWAKALIKQNQELAQKVETLEKDKTKQSKEEQAQTALKGSKLPDTLKTKWAGRINPDSETSIEEQVKELETEYDELHSGFVTSSVGKGLPKGGGNDGEASEDEAKSVAESL